ncbi:MAG: hypothetical protein B6244_13885 [Candidatus Cloacimonetes bacterium 4572_55]|nr:MAG: hypothetical protein B6244_13885 [Candidatus Cloacimonetes bacterium 4572_55]
MRLDKFLQVSRLIKQRSLAKEACEKKRVFIDGDPAKASREIMIGQKIKIRYAKKLLEVELVEIPRGNVSKKKVSDLYRVIGERRVGES